MQLLVLIFPVYFNYYSIHRAPDSLFQPNFSNFVGFSVSPDYVDDSAPFNAYACSDVDLDLCDDCSDGSYNPSGDGDDNDSDG